MTNKIVETIERYIGNRFYEPHPFKFGSVGMEAFSKIYHITRKQYPAFIHNNILNEIEKLLKEENIKNCFSCHMKLLVYAMNICENKLQDKKHSYTNMIFSLEKQRRKSNKRDYFKEVRASIDKYGELK